jgi:hypothetical protein
MIVSSYALLAKNPKPSTRAIREALAATSAAVPLCQDHRRGEARRRPDPRRETEMSEARP